VVCLARKKAKRAAKPARKIETESHELKSHESKRSGLSDATLKTLVIILGILVIGSAYYLGFQYGKLSVLSPVQQATATTPQQAAAATAPQQNTPPPSVPKTAKPKAELFIMAYCPFGLQLQKAWIPVEELLGKDADMSVKYVNYAMHGLKEVKDNTNEYCIQQEEPDKWTAFERCFVATTNYDQCADKVGIDKAKIKTCFDATDKQYGIMKNYNDKASWLSGRFPPYKVYDALNKQYGVRGSPTLVINGKQVRVSRSAEAVKEAICNAFVNPPKECSTKLSTTQEQAGPGPIGAGGSAPSAGAAGCGA